MALLLCLSLNSVSAIEGNMASQACRFDVDGLGLSGYQLRHVLMSAPTRASYKTVLTSIGAWSPLSFSNFIVSPHRTLVLEL